MILPNMDRSDFAAVTITPESKTQTAVVDIPDVAPTARALVVVAASGGGIWYLLWKISFYFAFWH